MSHEAATATRTDCCRRSRGSPISSGSRSCAGGAEEALEGRVVRLARRPDLAPSAVLRVLVVAEAQEARSVAEAVALHLVVAHLRDELGPDRRLGQLAGAPPVRLREAAVGCVLQQRLDALEDLIVLARGDGGRADVVDLPLLPVEAEQERCDAGR